MAPGAVPGWWQAEVPTAGHGTDYAFRLDGGDPLPDPRSPWQPYGINDVSRTYDHSAFAWTDRGWRGGPLHGSVIYELHIGTFTPEGTLDAAIGRLGHLTGLGVDTVRTDAGRRVPRRARVGLRRRFTCGPCTSPTAGLTR